MPHPEAVTWISFFSSIIDSNIPGGRWSKSPANNSMSTGEAAGGSDSDDGDWWWCGVWREKSIEPEETHTEGEMDTDVCFCRQKLPVLTSWSNNNPGKRYHSCKDCKFFKWVDPPMFERAKQLITGLLRKINSKDAEIEMQQEEIKSLHMKAMEMKLEMELTMK